MKQMITRLEESLAQAVKEHAALTGESVNSYVTRLLSDAVASRAAWKRDAISAGHLQSRPNRMPASADAHSRQPEAMDLGLPATAAELEVNTPAGYAASLVTADRDSR